MARLYADEQFPYEVVEHLRDLGHDVVTVQEAGKANFAPAYCKSIGNYFSDRKNSIFRHVNP